MVSETLTDNPIVLIGPQTNLACFTQLLRDCPARPQFCYIDDINSWSTNEITINWNAPLSWVASFLADQDDGR